VRHGEALMEQFVVKSLTALLLPPTGNLCLMLGGWLLRKRYRRVSRALVWMGALTLLAMSFGIFVRPLSLSLERYPPASLAALSAFNAQAIVVLGGGRYANAPEYGGRDTVSDQTLVRIRYGAYLHKKLGLPLLVTGGRVGPAPRAEAELMAEALGESFGVEIRWVEDMSRNTAENAQLTRRMLRAQNIDRVVLVTHSVHMWRSMRVFENAGFTAMPAGVDFVTDGHGATSIDRFLPSAYGVLHARQILHEYLGMVWYSLRY
jgi:uncharacterized SAM-binding protein YcdF (DUF218 family)